MGLTITEKKVIVRTPTTIMQCKIAFDSSYPDGGEAVQASDFGLKYLHHISSGFSENGYGFAYDPSEKKIKALTLDKVIRYTAFVADFDTGVIAMWRAPVAGSITKVTLHVGTTGTSSGATEIDVKKGIGGTTIFTTEPIVAYDDADGTEDNGTLKTDGTEDFDAGDIIELSVITDSATSPANMIVEIEFTPTEGEVPAATDLSSEFYLATVTGVGIVANSQGDN